MELRYLRYFVALAEELNFRRAAERLHVSAPTLSVQIKTLEGLLGVELCTRNTAMVRLTPAGEVLLHEAKDLLLHLRKVQEATKDAAHGTQGSLRIGSPGLFGYSFMPDALYHYRELFPKVDVSLMELDAELEQPAALENGTIQIGFVYGEQLPDLTDFEHLLVINTMRYAVMGPGHPLAALKQVPLARLAEYPLLCVDRGDSHLESMLRLFRKKNLKPKTTKKVVGFNAYIAMLIAGEGVSVLPDIRVLSLTQRLEMRPIKEAMPELPMQVHAVWKKSETSQQVHNFVDVLRKCGVHRSKLLRANIKHGKTPYDLYPY